MKLNEIIKIPNIKLKSLFSVLIAVNAIILMEPYFVWTTYHKGIFTPLINIIILLNLIAMAVMIYFLGEPVKMKNLFICGVFLFICVWQYYIGTLMAPGFSIGSLCIISTICLFILMDKKTQAEAFRIFAWLFAIAILPSIIYFILKIIGISIPMNILESEHIVKVANGKYYEQYLGGLLIVTPSAKEIRLCGIFDEPGVVGTFCALILASEGLRFKKSVRNLILLLGGILSLSLAFYLLLFIMIMQQAYFNGFKKTIRVCTLAIAVIVLFFNIETNNKYVKLIQNRFDFQSSSVIKNNRTNEGFNHVFEKFVENKDSNFWIGNGYEASEKNDQMYGSCSYKNLIYNHGVLGFLIIMSWLAGVAVLYGGLNYNTIIFSSIFLISIYQRPYVLKVPYMLVFFGALALIGLEEKLPSENSLKVRREICLKIS